MSLRAPLYSGHLFSTSEIWYQCELPPVSLREADLAGFLIERRDDTDCRRLLWCVCSGGSRCTSPLSSYSSRLLRRNQLWVCFVTCLDTVKGWNNHLLCSLSDQTGHVVHLDSCKWNKADMYTHTHTHTHTLPGFFKRCQNWRTPIYAVLSTAIKAECLSLSSSPCTVVKVMKCSDERSWTALQTNWEGNCTA